jgi:hypothetical protein
MPKEKNKLFQKKLENKFGSFKFLLYLCLIKSFTT